MMAGRVRLTLAEAEALCVRAAIGAGASEDCAGSIASAAVAAEADGQPTVGLSHFVDYLESLVAGRIDGSAEPVLSRPAAAIILSDAGGGSAHLGFDRAFDEFVSLAGLLGIAAFAQNNAYTCGSLGWFTGRLAERGLVAVAATNGPPMLAGSGTTKPVFCTNPLAFAAPRAGGPPLLIDQASSATAFVNVRAASQRGEALPDGWALGPDGRPTDDPAAAMRGALLAFGGAKGANIALMVEVLAAGLTGANWSLDAPSITGGTESPGSGLFVVAIAPKLFGPDFEARLDAHMRRLHVDYGLHVPGDARVRSRETAATERLEVEADVLRIIASFAEQRRG